MKIIRDVKVVHLITYAVLPPIIAALIWLLFAFLIYPQRIAALTYVSLIILVIASWILLKKFAIGCVLIYKVTAPEEVRSSCRFTPTCSTYMIMAINKYGLVIGVIKGIKRLTRCKPPNGGEDYP